MINLTNDDMTNEKKAAKTDKSLHNICIAAIKRNTMKPYDFKLTMFYETNEDFPYSRIQLDLLENEFMICSTIVDDANYSILTTRRLVTKQDGQYSTGEIKEANDKRYGDFKSDKDNVTTFGQVQLKSGKELKYFIETGRASMVMIHGIRMLIKTNEMTATQIDNIARAWNARLTD